MKLEKGDYVVFRLYYKHPGVRGYVWRESLAKVLGDERGGYQLWDYCERGVIWSSNEGIIRKANALEVFAYGVSHP